MAPNTSSVASMNTMPSTMSCGATPPRAGSANCGRKARKNTSTLGLVRFITTPRPAMRQRLTGLAAGVGPSSCDATAAGARKAPQAR